MDYELQRIISLHKLLSNFPNSISDSSYPDDFKTVNKTIQSSLIGLVKYYLIVKNSLRDSSSPVVILFLKIIRPLDDVEPLYYDYLKHKNPYTYFRISKVTEPYLDIMKSLIQRQKAIFTEGEGSLASIFGDGK